MFRPRAAGGRRPAQLAQTSPRGKKARVVPSTFGTGADAEERYLKVQDLVSNKIDWNDPIWEHEVAVHVAQVKTCSSCKQDESDLYWCDICGVGSCPECAGNPEEEGDTWLCSTHASVEPSLKAKMLVKRREELKWLSVGGRGTARGMNATDPTSDFGFFNSVQKGDLVHVKRFLEKNKNLSLATRHDVIFFPAAPALAVAADALAVQTFQLLLKDFDADPNTTTTGLARVPVLNIAAANASLSSGLERKKAMEILDLLLTNERIQLNATCSQGLTAHTLASKLGASQEILDKLRPDGPSIAPVMPAPAAVHRTAVVTHQACPLHLTSARGYPMHQENRRRIDDCLGSRGALQPLIRAGRVLFRGDVEAATEEQIYAVHEQQLLYRYEALSLHMSLPAGNKVIAVDNDFDTVMSAQSLPAAAGAAGACIEAMDMVIKGDVKNAFVLVRPPGHHVGTSGPALVTDNEHDGNGFGLLANSVIAMVAIIKKYPNLFKNKFSLANLDADIHKGNGVEELLLKRLMKDPDFAYRCSHHDFYLKHPQIFPYCDDESTDDTENGVFIRPVAPAKEREHTRRRLKVAFLDLLETVKKGKPQLLAFSLGFDGHEADPGMYGRGGLKTEDFRWMVRLLKKLVHDLGHDRLVLILEGGYAVEGGAAGPLACCIREVVEELESTDLEVDDQDLEPYNGEQDLEDDGHVPVD